MVVADDGEDQYCGHHTIIVSTGFGGMGSDGVKGASKRAGQTSDTEGALMALHRRSGELAVLLRELEWAQRGLGH